MLIWFMLCLLSSITLSRQTLRLIPTVSNKSSSRIMASSSQVNPEFKVGREEIPSAQLESDDAITDETSERIPCWLERIKPSIAKSRKIKGGNYVQLATIETDRTTDQSFPTCRTVVFRGFMPLPYSPSTSSTSTPIGQIAMKMITDARSEKVQHLISNPHSELVWWFPQSSEQYRIHGTIVLIGPDGPLSESMANASLGGGLVAERSSMWRQLSDAARTQFHWPQPGGPYTPYIPSIPAAAVEAGSSAVGEEVDGMVPPSFLLMLLVPTRVKYLRLRDNYAQNDEYGGTGSGGWESVRVNP